MATVEPARGYFERAYAHLPALVQQLYAVPSANDTLETVDFAEPETPYRDLQVLLLNQQHPPCTAVVAAFELLWPQPVSGNGGRVTPDKLVLGRLGMELVAQALERSAKTTIEEYIAAEGWTLLFDTAIRAFLKSNAAPAAGPASVPAAVAPHQLALPPQPAPPPPAPAPPPAVAAVKPAAKVPTPPEQDEDDFSDLFAMPPSRANTLEPAVQPAARAQAVCGNAAAGARGAGSAQLDDGGDFGGGFDDGGADVEQDQKEGPDGEVVGDEQEEEEEEEEGDEEEDEDLFAAESSDSDEDSDWEDPGPKGVKKRAAPSALRASPRKHPRVVPDSDDEDEVEAPRRSTAARSSTPSSSRTRNAPSPSPAKPKPAALQSTSPSSATFNPFDHSTFNVPSLDPPAALVARLETAYIRQSSSGGLSRLNVTPYRLSISISHTDIGGAIVAVIGQHLCLTPGLNDVPASPGLPFFLTFSSQKKFKSARRRLAQERSGSISLFVQKCKGWWLYYGEYREVTEQIRFLRGGAPFCALPRAQQDAWVDLVCSRLVFKDKSKIKAKLKDIYNTWGMKLDKNHLDKASIRRVLETQSSVSIEHAPWRCTGFDEAKVEKWHAAVEQRKRILRIAHGKEPRDAGFEALCEKGIIKAVKAEDANLKKQAGQKAEGQLQSEDEDEDEEDDDE